MFHSRRIRNRRVLIVLMAIVFFFGFQIGTSRAENYVLRLANPQPPAGVEFDSLQWMCEQVESRTGGQVKIQPYHGESLLKYRETLRGVQQGTADIGIVFVPLHPTELYYWHVVTTFISGPSTMQQRTALAWELYNESPELKDELGAINQKALGLLNYGDYVVGGVMKANSLAELKGVRIRCAGGLAAKQLADLGAQVIFLPGAEVYSSMTKGAVDASYGPLSTYYKFRLHEVSGEKSVLIIPRYDGTVNLITINLATYHKLPKNIQDILDQVGKEFSNVLIENTKKFDDKILQVLKDKQINVYTASPESVKKWAEMSESASIAEWLKTGQKIGKNGEPLLARTKELLKKYE